VQLWRFRAGRELLTSRASDMLIVQAGQLTVEDFHLPKDTAMSIATTSAGQLALGNRARGDG
jgi:hypothetical protein